MKREEIINNFPEQEFLFVDDMDDAIIGLSTKFLVVYSADKCIEILMKDMFEIEAIEYFEFNIEGAYMGEKTPIYVYDKLFD